MCRTGLNNHNGYVRVPYSTVRLVGFGVWWRREKELRTIGSSVDLHGGPTDSPLGSLPLVFDGL